MYLFLYHSQKPVNMPEPAFTGVDVQDFYAREDPADYLYRKDVEEYFANAIAESLDQAQHRDVKALIIDKRLGGDAWTRAILLAGHIVTMVYEQCALNRLPMILTDRPALDIADSSLISTPIY